MRNGKLKQEIVGWLFHGNDHETSHSAARKQHEVGTGKWFIESEEYSRWKDEQNSFLWLYGIPGCGKTVLWYCTPTFRYETALIYVEPARRSSRILEHIARNSPDPA
jgi:hypothetical protein